MSEEWKVVSPPLHNDDGTMEMDLLMVKMREGR